MTDEYETVMREAEGEASTGRYKEAYNTLGRALSLGGPYDQECRRRRGTYAYHVGHSRLDRVAASPANAEAGLRGPNAVDGLRGANAVDGLRGPNAVESLRGPNAVDGLRDRNAVDGLRRPNAADSPRGPNGVKETLIKAGCWLARAEAYLLSASEGAGDDARPGIEEDLERTKDEQERFRQLCRDLDIDLFFPRTPPPAERS